MSIGRITTFLLVMAFLLGGCQSRQLEQLPPRSADGGAVQNSSTQQSGQEEPPEPGSSSQEEQPTNQWYNETYISALSLYRLDDFQAPEDIPPDDWVRYYLMANYDGPGKMPIPEGYRNQQSYSLLIPGEEVEDFLTAHFQLEADYLQKAEGYVKNSKSYGFGALGLSNTAISQVTNVQRQGQELSIIFDVYLELGDEEASGSQSLDHPVATRIATITVPENNNFQVLSLQTLYRADLDALLNPPDTQ